MTTAAVRATAVTLADVARSAAVSTSTAARVLGGYGTVSAATRDRVLDVSRALGYRPNSVARSMVTGRTSTLGVVVGDVENPFFASLLRGFADVAEGAGLDVLLVNTDEQPDAERAALDLLLGRRVDGIAVAPASGRRTPHLERAVRAARALVLLDRHVPGLGVDSVGIDDAGAAQDAVARLLAAGHRRIALVTGAARGGRSPDPWATTGADRVRGYRRALGLAGIRPDPALVRSGDIRRESAREQAAALLALDRPPTAVLATDSTLALGVLEAARAAGLVLPDDLSLVAFGDAPWAGVVVPGLSVVAQPAYEIGATGARRLLDRLAGSGGRPRRIVLPTVFVSRGSVGAPPDTLRSVSPQTGTGVP